MAFHFRKVPVPSDHESQAMDTASVLIRWRMKSRCMVERFLLTLQGCVTLTWYKRWGRPLVPPLMRNQMKARTQSTAIGVSLAPSHCPFASALLRHSPPLSQCPPAVWARPLWFTDVRGRRPCRGLPSVHLQRPYDRLCADSARSFR